jgi:hypothetical protein
MHAVRTPVFGIGFAFVLLLLETLGARAYIADRVERQAQVERRLRAEQETTRCTVHPVVVTRSEDCASLECL